MQRQFISSATGAVAGRVDAGSGTTNLSPVVTDTSAVASDVGKPVTGAGIPAGTTIISVVPGVSFTMSANATATASVPVTVVAAIDAGAGHNWRNIYLKVATPARDAVVALETSPDNTTFTEVARVTGPNWGFARADHRQRILRANVISLGTGTPPASVNILASPV